MKNENNTLVLPGKLEYKTPTHWNKEKLWFEEKKDVWQFDLNCEQALIAEGIGKHKCPTIGKWTAFAITGSIIATLNGGKYIVPPEPEPWDWVANLENFTWEAFWQAFQENQEGLDRIFIEAMLRSFLPREYRTPPNHYYQMSNFVLNWGARGLEYPDAMTQSVGNIRLERLKKGREAFSQLPDDVKNSIRQVAHHTPQMLNITIKRIKKTYVW